MVWVSLKLGDLACFSSECCVPPYMLSSKCLVSLPKPHPVSAGPSSASLNLMVSHPLLPWSPISAQLHPSGLIEALQCPHHSHGTLGPCCISGLIQLRTGCRKTRVQCIHDLTPFEWQTPYVLSLLLKTSPLISHGPQGGCCPSNRPSLRQMDRRVGTMLATP